MATTLPHISQPTGASLLDRAVLISTKFERYGCTRSVKNIRIETDAQPKRLKTTKKLLESPEVDAIRKFDSEIREYVYSVSVPSYVDDGIYFVGVDAIPEVDEQLGHLAAYRTTLVEAAADKLDDLIADDRAALGDQFRPGDYPSKLEFLEAHSVSWRWLALSQPAALSAHPTIQARQEESEVNSLIAAESSIVALMRTNFLDCVSHICERLDGQRDNGKPKIFRDSLLNSTTTFLASFAFRNIMQDDALAVLVAETKEIIADVTPDELRSDEMTRANFLAGMTAIRDRAAALLN